MGNNEGNAPGEGLGRFMESDEMLNKAIIPQNQSGVTGSVDLALLLNTIDATESDWRQLPDPYPLFAEELRVGLCVLLGGG
jgi:hypothetical protein